MLSLEMPAFFPEQMFLNQVLTDGNCHGHRDFFNPPDVNLECQLPETNRVARNEAPNAERTEMISLQHGGPMYREAVISSAGNWRNSDLC
jgi:hypothetical protein